MTKKKKKSPILYIGLAVMIIVVLVLVFFIQDTSNKNELSKVYSALTCNNCDGSLQVNNNFYAVGMKQKIMDLQKQGYHKEELYLEAVKLFGVNSIIDQDLRVKTHEKLVTNPPEKRATLELSDTYVDFGEVSQVNQSFVMKEFTVTNTGNETLYIYSVGTSCSCLNVKFVTEDKESPSYGRFSFPYGMTVDILPGESQRLRVTYDARVNSFFRGFETRFVYINSNDVINPTHQITIDVIHND